MAFFARHLRHTEAEWAGRPFRLAPWQVELVRLLFGWKRADGTRLFRTLYLEVPRKNGKSELAAGLALLILLGDAEMGGQVYALAADEKQARLVFGKAALMVQLDETLSRAAEVFKTSIYIPELMAAFRPLSATPRTKHGLSPTGAVCDELHEWPDGELHEVVHKGTAARRQPLEVLITTAGVRGRGYGWDCHEHALRVLAGEVEDPTTLPVIYTAEPEADWLDPKVWAAANPNYGISVKPDYLAEEAAKAKRSLRLENDFRRFHLNQWTEQAVRWIRISDWDASAGPVPWTDLPAHLEGRRCFGAVDLSTKVDLTALVLAFPPEAGEAHWTLLARFFVPGERIADRIARDRVPYDAWIRAGAITATPGDVVDYDAVEAALDEAARRYELTEVAFDPWNAMQLALRMQAEGMTMVEFRQGPPSFSEPTKEFEALVLSKRLHHGGHPVLRWNLGNVAIHIDRNENIKPDKARSHERIDGVVAAIMALGRGLRHVEGGAVSIGADYSLEPSEETAA